MSVKPIPDGFHTVTPYLYVQNAGAAIDFYTRAFSATEVYRFTGPDGKIIHAELQIGDSRIMLGEECPEMGATSPKTLGGAGMGLMVYVENVDARFQQALNAGGSQQRPVADMFWGDRCGTLTDPFGHCWTLATHVEEVTPEECDRRFQAWVQSQAQAA